MNLQQKRYQFKYQPMADISSINNVDQIGIFFDTIKNKNFEEANKIMSEHNISIFSTDPQKNTILHYILLNVINNNITIADCIEICNNVKGIWGLMNVKNSRGQTPLHIICRGQLIDIYNLIPLDIRDQINYNIHDSYGRLALHYCIIGKQLDLPLFHYFYKYLKSQKNLTDEIKNIDMLMYKYKISNKDDKQMIKSNLYNTINKCINKLQSTIIYIPEMGKVKFIGINTLQDNNGINTDSVQLQDEQTTIINKTNEYYRISIVLYYIYKTLHITALLFFELNSINKANTLNTQSEYMCSLAIHIINILYHFSIGKKINIDKHLKIYIDDNVKKSINSDISNYSVLIQNVYYFILNSGNINLSYVNNININNILSDMYKYINAVNDYINIEMHFDAHILQKICICLLNLIKSLICMEHYNKDIKTILPLNITSIHDLYNKLILKHNSLITRIKDLNITDNIYTYYGKNEYLDFSRIENLQARRFIPKSGNIQQIYDNIFKHQIVNYKQENKTELNELPEKYKQIVYDIQPNIGWSVFDMFKTNFRKIKNTILEYTKKTLVQELNLYCDYIQNIIEHIIDLMNNNGFVRYQCMCSLLSIFITKSGYNRIQQINNGIQIMTSRIEYWNKQYKEFVKEFDKEFVNDIPTDTSSKQLIISEKDQIIKYSIYLFCAYCLYLCQYIIPKDQDQYNIHIITVILNIIKQKKYVEDQITIKFVNLIKYLFNRYFNGIEDHMIQFIYDEINEETKKILDDMYDTITTILKKNPQLTVSEAAKVVEKQEIGEIIYARMMQTPGIVEDEWRKLTGSLLDSLTLDKLRELVNNQIELDKMIVYVHNAYNKYLDKKVEKVPAPAEPAAAAMAAVPPKEEEHPQLPPSGVTSALEPAPEPGAQPVVVPAEAEKSTAPTITTTVSAAAGPPKEEEEEKIRSSEGSSRGPLGVLKEAAVPEVKKKTPEDSQPQPQLAPTSQQLQQQLQQLMNHQWDQLMNQYWQLLMVQQLQRLPEPQRQQLTKQQWQNLMEQQLWQLIESRLRYLINHQWLELSEPQRQQLIKQQWLYLTELQCWNLLVQRWRKLSKPQQQELTNQQWLEQIVQQRHELMEEQWQQYQRLLPLKDVSILAAAAALAAPEPVPPAPAAAAAPTSQQLQQELQQEWKHQMEHQWHQLMVQLMEQQWQKLPEQQQQELIEQQLWKLMNQQWRRLIEQSWQILIEQPWQILINQQWRQLMEQQCWKLMKQQLPQLPEQRQQELIAELCDELMKQQWPQMEQQWRDIMEERWQQYQQPQPLIYPSVSASAAVPAAQEPEKKAEKKADESEEEVWEGGNSKAKRGQKKTYERKDKDQEKKPTEPQSESPRSRQAAATEPKAEEKTEISLQQHTKTGLLVGRTKTWKNKYSQPKDDQHSGGGTELELVNKTNHKQINLPDISNIDLQSIFNKLLNGGTKSILSTIYDNLDINHNLKTTYQSGGDTSKYYTDHVCLLYNVYRDISTLSYYYFNYELYDEISKHTIYRPDETDIYNKSINYYIQLNTLLSLKKHNKKLFIFKTKDNKDIYELLSDGSKNNIMLWLIHNCMLLSLLDINISKHDILENIFEWSKIQTGGYSIPFNDIKYISNLYLDNLTDPILTNDEKYNLFISYKKQLQDDNSYDKYSTNTIFNKINTYLSKLFNRIYNYIFE